MKAWMGLSGIFVGAFLICAPLGNKAFANDSSLLTQREQATPPQGRSKSTPSMSSQGSSQLTAPSQGPSRGTPPTQAPTQPGSGYGPISPPIAPPFPNPGQNPVTANLLPVVPPPGMTMCTFINRDGVVMAIIVPAGSTCHTNADGSITVTFPDGTSFTIPQNTRGGIFYTGNYDPVIIVPYYGSTVITAMDAGYKITLPDGRIYMLPVFGRGGILWLFPPEPLPLQTPVVPPPGTQIIVFTNAYGETVAIIVPEGTGYHINPDGSITLNLPDNTTILIPNTARNGDAFSNTRGWSAVVVDYYGTRIRDWGPMGYEVVFSDGTSTWLHWYVPPKPPQPTTTPKVPSGLGIAIPQQQFRFWLYFSGLPIRTSFLTVVGVPGIQCGLNSGHLEVFFPGGGHYIFPFPPAPGAYTVTVWVDPDGPNGPQPGQFVTYHFAVIPVGSTVTSNGDGTYHVHPPAGYGSDFDFQYP